MRTVRETVERAHGEKRRCHNTTGSHSIRDSEREREYCVTAGSRSRRESNREYRVTAGNRSVRESEKEYRVTAGAVAYVSQIKSIL